MISGVDKIGFLRGQICGNSDFNISFFFTKAAKSIVSLSCFVSLETVEVVLVLSHFCHFVGTSMFVFFVSVSSNAAPAVWLTHFY